MDPWFSLIFKAELSLISPSFKKIPWIESPLICIKGEAETHGKFDEAAVKFGVRQDIYVFFLDLIILWESKRFLK